MAWDKEGQSSIVELAKDTTNKRLPSNFPIDAFLTKYQEWNRALRISGSDTTGLYASLRDMHQAAGINK